MAHRSHSYTPYAGTPPVAMTIAGSDSGGGAGIQADLKTFCALGVHGTSVVTALTAQNTCAVKAIHSVPAAMIEAQYQALVTDFDIRAIKTGMLGTKDAVETVARCLSAAEKIPVNHAPARARADAPETKPHLVVDPVLVATSGDALLDSDAIDALKHTLLPLADLVTPNRHEAAALLGMRAAETDAAAIAQAKAMLEWGCKAVLMKGGHADPGADACDILVEREETTSFQRPRVPTRNTHGTGCTLSAAITAALACGKDLKTAIAEAKAFVWDAIDRAKAQNLGAGHGPLAFPAFPRPDQSDG